MLDNKQRIKNMKYEAYQELFGVTKPNRLQSLLRVVMMGLHL